MLSPGRMSQVCTPPTSAADPTVLYAREGKRLHGQDEHYAPVQFYGRRWPKDLPMLLSGFRRKSIGRAVGA